MIRSRSRPWTPVDISLLLLMLGVAVWAFRTPLRDIFTLALRDDEQSHILLAPLVVLWLIWVRRSRLNLIRVKPNFLGCLVVALGCVVSWYGLETDTHVAWHGGGLIAIVGMFITMAGLEPLRQLGPAFLTLAFMIPVPGMIRQAIAIPLQSMATNVTHASLELFGYQSAKMGNILLINGEQVAVAEACNGMRLVFSLTLVVFAFAFSTPLRPLTRIILLAASPLVALLANVIRLVPTSLLYGSISAEKAELFHDISGWFMLPLALLALIGLLRFFKWLELPVSSYRLANT